MGNQREIIRRFLYENQAEMISLWKRIVDINSGTPNKRGTDEVCAVLAAEMKKSGIQVKIIEEEENGNTLVGTWNPGSTEKPVIFMGHMDTVFNEQTENGKFRIQNGKAYGHGVLDMKGGLVISIYVCRALQECGYCGRPVKFVFAGDEETAHSGGKTAETMENEIRGSCAAFNFETGDIQDGIVVGRLGAGVFTIETRGVAAHSGNNPADGKNALEAMARKIVELQNLNDIENGKLMNVAVIQAGEKTNIIPERCVAKGCFRFKTKEAYKELKQKILQICETVSVPGTQGVYISESKIECMEPSRENYRLFRLMESVAEETGYGPIHAKEVGGGSDSNIPASLGIPTVCGVGVRGEYNHTEREYAVVDSMAARCEVIVNTILRLDELE